MLAPQSAVQAAALELSRVWGAAAGGGDEWWGARGLEAGDWHALAANTLVEAFAADVLLALRAGDARVPLERGPAAARWAAAAARAPPPDVLRRPGTHTHTDERRRATRGRCLPELHARAPTVLAVHV